MSRAGQQEWIVRVVWSSEDRQEPTVYLRPASAAPDTDWQEFQDQDQFLRHLWSLIAPQIGLR